MSNKLTEPRPAPDAREPETARSDAPAEEKPPAAESKEVPSLYEGRDPEFDRPIFRKHRDQPPAAPTGSIIRRAPAGSPAIPKPTGPRQQIPRRVDAIHIAALPLKRVETGIPALDIRTGGLGVGTLNCLTGVDEVARSHLAVLVARSVAEQGGRVLALISPQEEGYWPQMPNLFIDVAVRRRPEAIVDMIESVDLVDLVVIDPMHSIETPAEVDRVAAMDNVINDLLRTAKQKRTTLLGVAHLVDRALRHEGVSLHPWMFRDISCLMEAPELILMHRAQRSGAREILVYRRGLNNRLGSLPSFVLPWS